MNTSSPQNSKCWFVFLAVIPLCLFSTLIGLSSKPEQEKHAPAKDAWISLFDGKTLEGWKSTDFGGQGDVTVKDGTILIEMGVDLSGITWQKPDDLPKINYEIEVDAMRVVGSDFFCGLTFPVNDEPCSLILGGWGGGVCGLSSIDDMDASENETTSYRGFEKGKWYHIRLRVMADRIDAWIDGEPIVEQEITDRKISVRSEVELSRPFGFATWVTTAALKNIRWRKVQPTKAVKTKKDS